MAQAQLKLWVHSTNSTTPMLHMFLTMIRSYKASSTVQYWSTAHALVLEKSIYRYCLLLSYRWQTYVTEAGTKTQMDTTFRKTDQMSSIAIIIIIITLRYLHSASSTLYLCASQSKMYR